MSSRRLGKGLEALIRPQKVKSEDSSFINDSVSIAIKLIDINPNQPRKIFNQKNIEELADSIIEKGILTPLTVKKNGNKYLLIAGERRLRAARLANLKNVPVLVRDVKNDAELLEMSLIENIQREDLNPIEEAEAFSVLKNKFSLSQVNIAKSLGKKRVTVSNSLRLLKLPKEIKESISNNEISAGHGRAILMEKTENSRFKLWEKIKRDNLSVRSAEKLVKDKTNNKKVNFKIKDSRSAVIRAVENEIVELLGTKVQLKKTAEGGKVVVHYFSDEDLERLLDMFRSLN